MSIIPKSIKELTAELQRLPGIGPKSARRLAYFMFALPQHKLDTLSDIIKDLKNSVTICAFCSIISDTNPCKICADQDRDSQKICVVSDSMDVFAIERSGAYKGLYYVLNGVLAPTKGVGPSEINIEKLRKRVSSLLRNNSVVELILALSPTMEGQTTALYVKNMFEEMPFANTVKITRMAIGLSVGMDIDYVDSYTLQEAIRGRSTF